MNSYKFAFKIQNFGEPHEIFNRVTSETSGRFQNNDEN